jgi:hypothetical protein
MYHSYKVTAAKRDYLHSIHTLSSLESRHKLQVLMEAIRVMTRTKNVKGHRYWAVVQWALSFRRCFQSSLFVAVPV